MLVAKKICKKFSKSKDVLNGLDFEAAPGQIIGIAGSNGSGKSTLLSIITSVMLPDAGLVTIDAHDIFKNPKIVKENIGFVPQDNALYESLSALDNIKLFSAAYGVDYRDIVFPDSKKKVQNMSGGMKKRLSIIISLLNNPKYVIMDEPTAALDCVFKKELMQMISSMKDEGRAVIFTSHQPDELEICDKLYVIRNGTFVFCGAPDTLCAGDSFQNALYKAVEL